jgi:hypothetical protein
MVDALRRVAGANESDAGGDGGQAAAEGFGFPQVFHVRYSFLFS